MTGAADKVMELIRYVPKINTEGGDKLSEDE